MDPVRCIIGHPEYASCRDPRVTELVEEIKRIIKYHQYTLVVTGRDGFRHYIECVYNWSYGPLGYDVPDTCPCALINMCKQEALEILDEKPRSLIKRLMCIY